VVVLILRRPPRLMPNSCDPDNFMGVGNPYATGLTNSQHNIYNTSQRRKL
jgi:hypothetical protein